MIAICYLQTIKSNHKLMKHDKQLFLQKLNTCIMQKLEATKLT